MTTRPTLNPAALSSRFTGTGSLRLASRSLKTFSACVTLFAALIQGRTASAQTVATNVESIVTDINHDGIPDLLSLSATTTGGTVLFGTLPYGTFNSTPLALNSPLTCSNPSPSSGSFGYGAIVVADFNGDGFPDYFVSCTGQSTSGAGTAAVMLGRGDGTFTPSAATFNIPYFEGGVAADFNHDGIADLVVISYPNGTSGTNNQTLALSFYAGKGDGTFAAPVVSPLGASATFQPGAYLLSSPVFADIDGDGYPDILLNAAYGYTPTNYNGATLTVSVFGNRKDGTFGATSQATRIPDAAVAIGTYPNTNPLKVLAGHFTSLTSLDLIVADTGSTPGYYLVKNNSTAGSFSLGTAVKTSYPGLQSLVKGIFSGSGYTDLAVADGAHITALTNDGTGTFSASYSGLSIQTSATFFNAVDANNDGYTDIYTASALNNTVSATVNLVTGTATATSQPFTLPVGSTSITATWPGNLNYNGSAATTTQTVNATPTGVTLTSSQNPAPVNTAVTFTAIVGSTITTGQVPTGIVTFLDGSTTLGTATLDNTGTATLTTSTLSATTHSIVASYSGDGFFAASTSTLSQTITPVGQLTGNLLQNPGAELGLVNGAIPYWTAAGPGTPTVDTGTFNGGINPHTGTYDFLGQNGASDSLSQRVSIVSSAVTPQMIDSGTLSANLSFWEQGLDQGTPSDDASVTLSFLDVEGNVISTVTSGEVDSHNGTWQNFTQNYTIPAGTRSITYAMNFIRHAGSDLDGYIDDNSLIIFSSGSSVPLASSTTLASSLNPATVGSTITFTANVTGAATSTQAPTGTVIFSDGTTVLGSSTLVNGTTTYSTSTLTAATHSIQAVYSGDPTYASSSSAVLSQVVQAPQGFTISPTSIAFGNQTAGTQSAAQAVTLSNLNTVTINIADILLILGPSPSDFTQTNNCPTALQPNATCLINISFTPHGVGFKTAGIEIDDDSTPSTQSVNFTGTGTGGILQVNPGNLKTIAGTGAAGYTGDGGQATAATLNLPAGVAIDPSGNIYIADELNSVVRKVSTTGVISTFAGTGVRGYTGDGGQATAAQLKTPTVVVLDSTGNVYITDAAANVVRKVSTSGVISTFAGTGTAGHSGDGGPATSALLNQPQGAHFDRQGNLYIAQCVGASIRRIDTNGIITTVAGNFTAGFSGDGGPAISAQLFCPSGVDIDAAGNLYIADDLNNRIRKVDTTGTITTIAGDGTAAYNGDNINASAAELNLPNDLVLDSAGNLYIADSGNNRIRKISTTGTITTVVGGLQNAGSAAVNTPLSLNLDAYGNLYFVDSGNNAVREFFPMGTTPFPVTPVAVSAAPQTLTLSNIGNVALTIPSSQSFTLSGNASDFTLSGGTCLTAKTVLAPSATCTLQITFTPTAVGLRTLTVSIADSALNSPQSFNISGTGTQGTPTISWTPTVSSIPSGTPLSAQQLNATATGAGGVSLSGAFTYTPAAGIVLPAGTQTLSVTFNPTDTVDYTTTAATIQIQVTATTLTSITPNTAKVGDPNTTITLTGTGFTTASLVQVNGARLVTTFVNATTLTAVVPAADFAAVTTLQVSVVNPSTSMATSSLPLSVTAPTPSVTVSGPSTSSPGTQPSLALTIVNPYPIPLTATFTLTFASSVTPAVDDPSIQFASGGRTFSFTVPANSTTVPAIQLQAGTVAGTITVPVTLTAAGVNVTPASVQPVVITVPAAVPTVSTASITRSGAQFTVTVHGFSNTREVSQATFHFNAATGASIDTPDITVPVTTIFSGWFTSAPSATYGSTFTYTQIFNVSDTAANIGSVQVTLTNSAGVSTVYNAQ